MKNIELCPVKDIMFSVISDKKCSWVYDELNYKRGEYGKVYEVCCNSDCNYIVKIQSAEWNDEVLNEIKVHKEFEKLGVGIPLIEAYICEEHGSYMIMEKRNATLEEYIKGMIILKLDADFIIKQINRIEETIKEFIKKAHSHGLVHDDLHPNNIMLNIMNDNTYSDIVLIDFGSSSMNVSDVDKYDKVEDITQMFNYLRSSVNK